MIAQTVLFGLVQGCLYALLAVGFALICGILKMITFAHGEVFMVGAFVALGTIAGLGLPFPVGLVIGMAVAMLLGILIERIAFRPFRNEGALSPALITIGFSIALQALVLVVAGADTKPVPYEIFPFRFTFAGLVVSGLECAVLATTATLMLLLHLFMRKTRWGLALRATSVHFAASSLMGVNTNVVIAITFGLASALAGAAGLLVGIYYGAFYPQMGVMFSFKALAAATLGGITSVTGAIIGGLVLGLIEGLAVLFIASSYKDIIAFSVLILILLLKPAGLFGTAVEEKV